MSKKTAVVEEPRPKTPNINSLRTLVLNADYQPVEINPLSVWPWQKAMKLIYEDVVDPVAYHEDVVVHSAHAEHQVPSVVVLRNYVPPASKVPFTKYNVFLRDEFRCQYCRATVRVSDLTFDHVLPKSRGGKTEWENIASACHPCNGKKDNKTPKEAGMRLMRTPYEPTVFEIREKGKKFPPSYLHETWRDYVYWDAPLEK